MRFSMSVTFGDDHAARPASSFSAQELTLPVRVAWFPVTTTLSLFAALFGVFYTAVVVSVFVGLAQSAKSGGAND